MSDIIKIYSLAIYVLIALKIMQILLELSALFILLALQ